MAARRRFVIVGAGMMGAAAARHLANICGRDVTLIGSPEPAVRVSHHGVFASHYDEGRITRAIDPDPVWASLAGASIARYREIEEATGISFYGEVGSLLTGPATAGYVRDILSVAQGAGLEIEHLAEREMAARFPWFAFPDGTQGIFEARGAGHISPRRLVRAQIQLAERAGAEVIAAEAVRIEEASGGAVVILKDGNRIEADTVLAAAGGFSIQKNLLPQRPELKVYARTVVFFEVSEEDAARYAAMPSMINKAKRDADDTYMLPAIRYPDGRFYLKIGGDPDDLVLTDEALGDWFRGQGRKDVVAHLTGRMQSLVPGLQSLSISSAPCVTSFTASGYPAIGWLSPGRIGVVTGGCGSAAKSSDEIGRLGAELAFEGRISSRPDAHLFAPVFST